MQDVSYARHRSQGVQKLITDLTAKIRTGELHAGDYLPSAHSLAKEYGIGYSTVIRTYKTLAEAGLVDTVQGRGAFVRDVIVPKVAEITVCLPSSDTLSQNANPLCDWVFHGLLAGMNAATLARGAKIHLLFADEVGSKWTDYLDGMEMGAGVLFVLEAPPAWIMRLVHRQIPFALVMPAEHGEWENEIPRIYADYHGGVYQAVTKLLNEGFERPLYLGGIEGHEKPRYEGFAAAVAHKKNENSILLPCSDISRHAGFTAMSDYLFAHPEPDFDLIVGSNDLRALGAMDALQARGIRVPDDVAVLGFDDIPSAKQAELSSVRLPVRELGKSSINWFLDSVVDNVDTNVPSKRIPCPTVWRNSTGHKDNA